MYLDTPRWLSQASRWETKKRSGGPTERSPTATSVLWSAHQTKSTAPGTAFPRDELFGDVYVDDLAVLARVATSHRTFVGDQLRVNQADAMYAALGMPIKKPLGEEISLEFFGVLTSMATVENPGSICVDGPPSLSAPASEPSWVSAGCNRRDSSGPGDSLSRSGGGAFVAAEGFPSRKPCTLSTKL